MFKFKSYSVSNAEKKSETGKSNSSSSSSSTTSSTSSSTTSSTGTIKKKPSSTTSQYVSPKTKTKPTAREIKDLNNYQPPEYSKKIYPKKTVTEWHSNKTFSAKNKTEKLTIPSPKKKLERK